MLGPARALSLLEAPISSIKIDAMLNMVSRQEIRMLVRKDHKRQAVILKEAGSPVGQYKQQGIGENLLHYYTQCEPLL